MLPNHPRYDFVEEGVAGDERQVLCLFKDEKMHLVQKTMTDISKILKRKVSKIVLAQFFWQI